MAVYNACEIPEELYYDVDYDVWVRLEEDGTVTLGMTDPAQAQCGRIVNITFKGVGKSLRRGQSAAIIESAKWVGPFPTPLSGVIVAVNEGFRNDLLLANKDPYGAGWLIRLRPTNFAEESKVLLTGSAAFEAYRKKIDQRKVHCIRCAG
ncbi:MAG: glycine cleavage system protein H [Armatimonadota bacterium]|nr:glycine cleavage system protein H [Armatimonadota bacterium]MDR5702285.1 glycine cleavage system protein H [Armatimonadota bacterium]